jgi:hypothetical protein
VGFGTEILFMLMLGLVVLEPKRLHAMLGHGADIGTANPSVRSTSFHAAGCGTSASERVFE